MIDVFGANGFGCLKNVELKLTKLHALVGPNDSGKSTILRGIRTLSALGDGPLFTSDGRSRLRFVPNMDEQAVPVRPTLRAGAGGLEGRLTSAFGVYNWETVRGGKQENAHQFARHGAPTAFVVALRNARIVRWVPDALRRSSGHADEVDTFLENGGAGLPGVLARTFLRDDGALAKLNERMRSLFPAMKAFRVVPESPGELRLEFTLHDGRVVKATDVSDGALYALAFAAAEYIADASIFLLEEPENGLHPARIAEVVAGLRALTESGKAQVIMATHSPLIINELQPEEVTIVTRTPEQGTRVTPIAETTNFGDRSKAYALGELWLSYCDGRLEEELVPAAKAG